MLLTQVDKQQFRQQLQHDTAVFLETNKIEQLPAQALPRKLKKYQPSKNHQTAAYEAFITELTLPEVTL